MLFECAFLQYIKTEERGVCSLWSKEKLVLQAELIGPRALSGEIGNPTIGTSSGQTSGIYPLASR
jgi:hypothetical protein